MEDGAAQPKKGKRTRTVRLAAAEPGEVEFRVPFEPIVPVRTLSRCHAALRSGCGRSLTRERSGLGYVHNVHYGASLTTDS